jgi:hypothetical protein
MIQAALPTSDANYQAEVEEQKFSYKAGITIEVDTTATGTIKPVSVYAYDRDPDGKIIYDSGVPRKIALSLSDPTIVEAVDFEVDSSSGLVLNGLYDHRRGRGVGLVTVDIDKLKDAVEDNDALDWGGSANQKPDEWWNGIVYVKTTVSSGSGSGRSDFVTPAVEGWGVKLVNGSEIPNPSFAVDSGTTIATNNVLYVQGDYNADGSLSSGSPTDPDNATEPPAALAADAINVLSNDWDDSVSAFSSLSYRKAAHTEVSAAFLTGLAPSDQGNNNAYSGGVENFPRFLEDWGSRTLQYRGSMVSLFESEIADERWSYGGSIYKAPRREWGFHKLFGEGTYPPGTPNTRDFRRINYRDLTPTEWAVEMSQLKTDLGI